MKKELLKLSILLPLFFFSCADKEKSYDKDKAISVFAVIDSVKIDKSLSNVAIELPTQKENSFWNGSSSEQNQRVENFSKKFLLKKTFWQNSSEIHLKESSEIWSSFSFISEDEFVFSPVIRNNIIYLLNSSGKLQAYNLENKKKIWKTRVFPHSFLKNYRTPKIYYSSDKIFAVAGTNKVAAVDANKGKLLWIKNISAIPVSTPVSDGQSVFVTTNDNKLYALDTKSGEIKWVVSAILRNTAILGAADPVIDDENIIASFSSGEIYSINRKNGDVLWSQDLNISRANSSDFYLNDIDATPIIKDSVVYSIGNGGLMMAINSKNGNYLWKKEIAGVVDFWIAGDFIYLINNDNKLMAIYRKTGGVKWVKQLPNLEKDKKPQTKIIYDGVLMAGGKLLVSNVKGEISIISPFDGSIEKTVKTGERTYHVPIIVGDKIYLHRLGSYVTNLLEIE